MHTVKETAVGLRRETSTHRLCKRMQSAYFKIEQWSNCMGVGAAQ